MKKPAKPKYPILYGIYNVDHGEVGIIGAIKNESVNKFIDVTAPEDVENYFLVEIKRIGRVKRTYVIVPLDD